MFRSLSKLRGSKMVSGEMVFARGISVVNGDMKQLPQNLRKFVEGNIRMCQPDAVHICDGSERENRHLLDVMVRSGQITKLPKFENCWYARTDERDVARVEAVTYMCTPQKRDTVPTPLDKVKSKLGNWIPPSECEDELHDRFPGCMRGRTMYVIPFSMGPVGSRLSKVGLQLTDSPYVVASMRIMTRIGAPVLKYVNEAQPDVVRALHSVGVPIDSASGKPIEPAPRNVMSSWPCYPDKTFIVHLPEMNEICSFGSGYGGNSLLGKKCFALRLGSILARKEGWLAEHMLIVGITNPKGVKKYVAAAFPSACGKTNMAMLRPTLPGYKVECVGDDIAWMKFDDEGDGRLYAINPEAGFFGVAPGTSWNTNPVAMQTIQKNTIFTNVATTSDGGVYWKGLEDVLKPGIEVRTWKNAPWRPHPLSNEDAAHANSRFCTPASQCPIIDPKWESERGVPISAIIFGGRRPQGVPLVYEAFNWAHGVFIGASMRSQTTAASAEGAKQKKIEHDPFAMRPFFGYNFGRYLEHWLGMEKARKVKRNMPKVFHVNWFREGSDGGFLWPGFGDNVRVIDWICRRVDNEDVAQESPIGYLPKPGTINGSGLNLTESQWSELFSVRKEFWQAEAQTLKDYFENELNVDLPDAVRQEVHALQERVAKMQ